jgi:hypothetical protein
MDDKSYRNGDTSKQIDDIKRIRSYFMVDYSFYSKEHGGTFHFL